MSIIDFHKLSSKQEMGKFRKKLLFTHEDGTLYYAKNLSHVKEYKAQELDGYKSCLWLDVYNIQTQICTKMDLSSKPEIYSYVGGQLLNLYLGERVSRSALTATEGTAYLLSPYLNNFRPWFKFNPKNASKNSSILIKDFELVILTSIFLGDYDLHAGNIGEQELGNEIIISKVDHDSCMRSFFYKFPNHDHHKFNLASILAVLTLSNVYDLDNAMSQNALKHILSTSLTVTKAVVQHLLVESQLLFAQNNVPFEVKVDEYAVRIMDRINDRLQEAQTFLLDLRLEEHILKCDTQFAYTHLGIGWQGYSITCLSEFQKRVQSEFTENEFYQALDESTITLGQLSKICQCEAANLPVQSYSLPRKHFDAIDSLLLYAQNNLHLSDNPSGWFVFTAAEQTNGFEWPGKNWFSPKGNMYITFLFQCPIQKCNSVTELLELTALSVASTIELYDLPAKVKWKNDVFINNKKVSGNAVLFFPFNDLQKTVLVNINLNINMDVEALTSINQRATSMKIESGKEFLVTNLIKEFEALFHSNILRYISEDGFLPFVDEINSKILWHGNYLCIKQWSDNKEICGLFYGIDSVGGALLLAGDNSHVNIFNGTIIKESVCN